MPAERRDTRVDYDAAAADAEFAAGMHLVDRAITDGESPQPAGLDLLWFR